MIVGRVGAHPGAARHLSEREGPVLLVGNQFQRRVDQSATEVAVMIGARGGAANFFRQDGSMDVDTAYNVVYSVYICCSVRCQSVGVGPPLLIAGQTWR